jgi:hypothetical protein
MNLEITRELIKTIDMKEEEIEIKSFFKLYKSLI